MKLLDVFINPQTALLRSGWRVFIFITIVLLPYLASALFLRGSQPSQDSNAVFSADWAMVLVYVALNLWLVLVSWLCLRFLEGLDFASLGFAMRPGWWREVLLGLVMSVLMILLVVTCQSLAGGTQLSLNPVWWQAGMFDLARACSLAGGLAIASILLCLAAAFEELSFRGYVFQTLLRDLPSAIPILLLSLFFGLAHCTNPNRTLLSTLNTLLAGVWLAVAYLRTRSLWLPTALHFGWNWMMGVFFGLPISGLPIRPSLFVSTDLGPDWLTGGAYGCEGGWPTTLVFTLGTLWLWRTRWLRFSLERQVRPSSKLKVVEPPLKLGLTEDT